MTSLSILRSGAPLLIVMLRLSAALPIVGLAALAIPPAQASECGKAAWYQHTSQTANGERGDPKALAAAHRTLPFGTHVLVENLDNGKSIEVRINDRGPYGGGRVIDVTRAAAVELGMIATGTAKVRITPLGIEWQPIVIPAGAGDSC